MVTRILPLGDSLTWGVSDNNTRLDGGVRAGDRYGGYRTVLQDSLTAQGFANPTDFDFVGEEDNTNTKISGPNSIDNDHQGQRGDTIAQLNTDLTRQGGALLNTLDPDIVLLMAGTNDVLKDEAGVTVATMLDRLETLIETLATKAEHILVASIPPLVVSGTIDKLDAADETQRQSFNSQLPAFLQDGSRFTAGVRAKLTFVDVGGALQTSDISSDGVHLTSLGFSKVATAWHNALVPILDPSTSLSSIERGTPQRLEAEDFNNLGGFVVQSQNNDGLPDDTQVIRLANASGSGTATTSFSLPTGTYDVVIGYFDENDAVGQIRTTIGNDTLTSLTLNQNYGDADASTDNYVRKTIGKAVQLTQGETISLTGTPGIGGNNELIWVDYLEFIPVPVGSAPPHAHSFAEPLPQSQSKPLPQSFAKPLPQSQSYSIHSSNGNRRWQSGGGHSGNRQQ